MTLAEELHDEIRRCRELLNVYNEMGPASVTVAGMLCMDLDFAESAALNNSVVHMLKALKRLREYKF